MDVGVAVVLEEVVLEEVALEEVKEVVVDVVNVLDVVGKVEVVDEEVELVVVVLVDVNWLKTAGVGKGIGIVMTDKITDTDVDNGSGG